MEKNKVEFDFSDLLRTLNLKQVTECGVSTENVIIEYLETYPPAESQDCLVHSD